MNDEQLVPGRLAEVLDAFPTEAPHRLLTNAMTTVRVTHQRRGTIARLGYRRKSPSAALPRRLTLAAGAAGLVIIGLALSFLAVHFTENVPAASPSTGTFDQFEVPFTYQAPAGVPLIVARSERSNVELVTPPHGAGTSPLPSANDYPYQEPFSGLLIASTSEASVDRCGIGLAPIGPGSNLISVLELVGNNVSSTPAVIDGRDAFVATVSNSCGDGLHVSDELGHGVTLHLSRPLTRNYFVEVRDTTVVIQVWASESDAFDDWLPIAQSIVDSIHFVNSPTATPSHSQTTITASEFEFPFQITIPQFQTVTTGLAKQLAYNFLTEPTKRPVSPVSSTEPNEIYSLPHSGLLVASTTDGSFDNCPRSILGNIPINPAVDLLSDLEDRGGMHFNSSSVVIDGRPAISTEVAADCLDHLHLGGVVGDNYYVGPTLNLALASSQLYLVTVGGSVVVIQIWAASPEELDQWLPTAEQMVASIHFLDQPR